MTAFTRSEIEGSLTARFEARVDEMPEHPALGGDSLVWTYRELNRCANRLARRLPPTAETEPTPVLLLLGHGALEIVALLAVLKSGRAYVALDPRAPLPRLRQIAADSGAERVITCRDHADLAGRLPVRTLELPPAATLLEAARGPATAEDDNLDIDIGPDALAALVYTSGSTGTPKGVMRSHRCVLHRAWLFQNDQGVGPGDRIAHLFSCGFVAAEVDVYGALLNGGTLCCYPARELGYAPLAGWLAEEAIALLHPPPALWRRFIDSLDLPPNLPALRTLFLAGEAVHRAELDRTRRLFPDCVVEHRLSSSETSVLARHLIAPGDRLDGEAIPVGRPVADKTLWLLDRDGREAAPGEAGEIVVFSRYLSPGYWRQPALTAARFVPVPNQGGDEALPMRRFHTGDLGRFAPDSGLLIHLGRLDEQVKVRGYRVETREVEAALLGLAMVESAAVVPRPGPDGEKALVACLVLRPGETADAGALRGRLAEILPEYMIPSSFEFLERLPLTANGKIDRRTLAEHPAPIEPLPATGAPAGGTEEGVARIWRDALGLEQVGRTDNFFSLGGHSLLAARVVARVNEVFHLALPLAGFYRVPTIADLAALIDDGGAATLSRGMETGKDLARALSMLEKF